MPRIVAIQSANCAPLYRAFKEKLNGIPVLQTSETLAEGIAISTPIRGKQIVEAVKESKGDFIVVSDSEIKSSLKEICKKGFYIEPTSAATTAGISKYLRNSNSEQEIIVSVFTGHGLKSTRKSVENVTLFRADK